MAGDIVTGKPPKPRLSQSPSSFRRGHYSQLNLINAESNQVKHKKCNSKVSNDNFGNIDYVKSPNSLESVSTVSEENDDNHIEELFEVNNQKSICEDDNDDGEEEEEEGEEEEENADEITSPYNQTFDTSKISRWIDQVLKPNENPGISPFPNPSKLDFSQKPDTVHAQTLNPTDDILTQWRLRRRMEQARLEISNDRLNKPGGFLQSATLSMHTNMLLPQYSHFPSQITTRSTRMMDRREYQLFLREPNLEFDIKVEIESNCGTNLDKYMLNKLNYYDYDRNTSFNQYKNPIRYPSKSSSPSFLSSSSPPSQSIQRMSPKPAVMLPYILPNLDTKLLTENPSRLLCLLEEMLLSRGLYMVPFQSPIHSYRIGKQLGGFNSNEMIAYRGGRRNDALYEDNDIAFLGSRSEDTRPMSNSPSPIYLPTTQSIRPLPTKIYLRDVSIQCDITQKYSMNNESQIQAKKNHSIDASVYCKPSDIVKKSDMQEVEIMTNMSAIKSPLRTKQKSVRIMVRPHSRSVKLQTPSSMASYKSENRSIKSPMCKNLCISVDKTHRQSVSSPHSTISSTLSPNNNNNHINATANYGSHSPFSPLGDAESVHSIETDSWVWPTTPSMKSDKNSSSQLLSNTLDNEIIEKDNSQKNNSSNSPDSITNRTFTQLPGISSTEYTATKFMLDGEIQIGLTIARYIEENLNIDETSSSSSYDWPEDNILQDLRKRRADCIEKMKLIMKQIHEREEELINNHSAYPE